MAVTIPDVTEVSEENPLTDQQREAVTTDLNLMKDTAWDKDIEAKPQQKEQEKDTKDDEEAEPAEKDKQQDQLTDEQKQIEETENKRIEDKAKSLSKTAEEIKQLEADEKAETERIEKAAKEQGITIEQVKEEESKDKAIVERHGNDAIKIARALRKEQSEYGKSQAELKELRALKQQVEIEQKQFSEQAFERQMQDKFQDVVEKYRSKFTTQPDGRSTDELSDDACFEKGKAIIKEALKNQQAQQAAETTKKASDRRTELINTLPEQFKDFVPEVKELLDQCKDNQVIHSDFDIEYLANYARGKKFTAEYVKSLEDAAYKRGLEQAKPSSTTPRNASGKSNTSSETVPTLTDAQKRRAEEMYSRRDGWSKDKMYQHYAKNDLKDDF